jgi:hypothetical protein
VVLNDEIDAITTVALSVVAYFFGLFL